MLITNKYRDWKCMSELWNSKWKLKRLKDVFFVIRSSFSSRVNVML